MTISQERTVLTTMAAGRVEFATVGAHRGANCPWLVQGEVRREDGVREQLYIIAEPTESVRSLSTLVTFESPTLSDRLPPIERVSF